MPMSSSLLQKIERELPGKLRGALRHFWGSALPRFAVSAAKTMWWFLPEGLASFARRTLRHNCYYVNMIEKKPLAAQSILYESFHAQTADDNPFAIFCALVDNPDYVSYRHIWAVNDPESSPLAPYLSRPNVTAVRHGSRRYFRFLATCKYLVNNVSFFTYFIKREGQVYLNTWHGTPLKTLGKDIVADTVGFHANVQRNLLLADYLIQPNRYTSEKITNAYDLEGIYPGIMAETGYPRTDTVLNSDRKAIRTALGISDGDTMVLYAPTWRGKAKQADNNAAETNRYAEQIRAGLPEGYRLILKCHPLQRQMMQGVPGLAPHHLDTGRLLCATDILITDYSSIFFDFLPTKRPILFFTYDEARYENDRGFYLPREDLPGPRCTTVGKLQAALSHIAETAEAYRETYDRFARRFAYLDDGKAALRAADLLFHGRCAPGTVYPTQKGKKNVLIYPGTLEPCGVTSAALSLTRKIDRERYNVCLLLDYILPSQCLRDMPEDTRIIFTGGPLYGRGERWRAYGFLMKKNPSSRARLPKTRFFEREASRLFGDISFDTVIHFEGYTRYPAALLPKIPASNHLIYLHNDMVSEYKAVSPHLSSVFRMYPEYDRLVCVSRGCMEQNIEGFKYFMPEIISKMTYSENTIDEERVLRESQCGSDIRILNRRYYTETSKEDELLGSPVLRTKAVPLPVDPQKAFICIGKCSPLKNTGLLLRAFSRLVQTHPAAKLYIVGAGPLMRELRAQAQAAGLLQNVFFTGVLKNPRYLMAQCGCLILPSKSEGQPISLLEAFILKKAAIVSNTPGSRELCEKYGGYILSETTEKGLENAMRNWLQSGAVQPCFDARSFNQHSMQMFYNLIAPSEIPAEKERQL